MQGNKLFVGGIDYQMATNELEELFSKFGSVIEVKIIEGKGFGFVTMSSQEEAEKAKEGLNGYQIEGRRLRVEEAKPPRKRDRAPFANESGRRKRRY